VIATPASASTATGTWQASGIVGRTSATAQIAWMRSAQASGGNEVGNVNTVTTPAETLSGSVIVKVTGQSNTTSNDIVIKGFVIEILN
jgi:hypothetical protein